MLERNHDGVAACRPVGRAKISSRALLHRLARRNTSVGPASNGRSRETRTHCGLLRVDAPIITPRVETVVIKLLETGQVLLAPCLPAKTSRLPAPTVPNRWTLQCQCRDEYARIRESTIVSKKTEPNLAHVGPHPQPHRKSAAPQAAPDRPGLGPHQSFFSNTY